MPKAAQKITATTQKFTEIEDVVDEILVLSGGNAAVILEVKPTNFALLSAEEQDSKIFAYAAFLNSLSFPIQISIISKKLDVSSYIKSLETEAQTTKNPYLGKQIGLYKNFVSELVKVNTILDKKFYITISYSFLEAGAKGVAANAKTDKSTFLTAARSSLKYKAESVMSQLGRVGLRAEVLEKDKIIKLFHDLYNEKEISHQVSLQNDTTKGVKK